MFARPRTDPYPDQHDWDLLRATTPRAEAVRVVKPTSSRPFNNYNKFETKRQNLLQTFGHALRGGLAGAEPGGQSPVLTGPYISAYDQWVAKEQAAKAKSMHKDDHGRFVMFKPGGPLRTHADGRPLSPPPMRARTPRTPRTPR